MTEKKELKSTPSIPKGLSISKTDRYKDLTITLDGIDSKRTSEFNSMKKIEVTKEELLKIGKRRWLQNI